MTDAGAGLSRRSVLRGLGGLGLLAVVPACSSRFDDVRLTLATGGTQGVYFNLGTALAQAWFERLDLAAAPEVRSTAGSVDNLRLLTAGAADVGFSQVDAAAEQVARTAPDHPRALRALARVYDEFVHVVVADSAPVRALADLRGARVSVGAPNSGVIVIAKRLLEVAGLAPGSDLRTTQLGINESVDALAAGRIDAFFWVGGLPTRGVAELAARLPIRLLDLEDVFGDVRKAHPEYASGTVPARTYGIREPVTTLLVRNFLLVRADMPDDLAYALVETVFRAQEQLALASPAARAIDLRAAIATQPVPLHPGAQRYYRAAKSS